MKPKSIILAVRTIFPLIVLSLLLLPLTLPIQVNGQDTPDSSASESVTADEVNEVAKELWCPLCSGVRLDSCELRACDQMKDVIAIKLAEGEDTDSIRDYFVEQYGPQVLGEPPREGFNWLAWILPFAALIGGAVFLWFRTQRMFGAHAPAAPQVSEEAGVEDEYQRKLEEELDEYG